MMDTHPESTPKKRIVQAVDRALWILKILGDHPNGLTLTQLAQKINLHLQTVQSLLRTLQAHHCVNQPGRGQPDFLGPAIAQLAMQFKQGRNLAAMAEPHCADLAKSLSEYVLLAELAGSAVTPLIEISPQRTLIVRSEIGANQRLHTMATGKMLMAMLDTPTRTRILGSLELTEAGPNAVTDAQTLENQLDTILQQGHAICIDEASLGIAAMAVPLTQPTGDYAALGIAVPTVRFDANRQDFLLNTLHATATAIEQAWKTTH